MFIRFLFIALISQFLINNALAAPKVVASIKPIHALVSVVMGSIGKPELLLDGQSSPHHASLRPSQARALQDADLIFWVGPELETFLEKPMATLPSHSKPIPLIELQGLHFPEHLESHDDHHHDRDPHIWLDPQNASLMVQKITHALSQLDPQNTEIYEKNRTALLSKISAQQKRITQHLAAIANAKYITFHDAYGHFEHGFNLPGGSTIMINSENRPGAARIQKLRAQIKSERINCVFSEPQFDPKIVTLITENSNAKTAELDPLGSRIPQGSNFYQTLIENLAKSFAQCLIVM